MSTDPIQRWGVPHGNAGARLWGLAAIYDALQSIDETLRTTTGGSTNSPVNVVFAPDVSGGRLSFGDITVNIIDGLPGAVVPATVSGTSSGQAFSFILPITPTLGRASSGPFIADPDTNVTVVIPAVLALTGQVVARFLEILPD